MRALKVGLIAFLLSLSWTSNAQALSRLKNGDLLSGKLVLKGLAGKQLLLKEVTRGKKVVALVFFKFPEVQNVYRDYSKEQLDHLASLYEWYSKQGLEVVAIYCPWGDQGISKPERELLAKLKLPFTVVVDRGLKLMSKLGAFTMPALVLTDRWGKVIYTLDAYPDYAEREITQKIEKSLKLNQNQRMYSKRKTKAVKKS